MRVAVVHDWLTTYAGSERVLQEILATYPDADLFSLVDFLPEGDRQFLGNRSVQTSFVQRLPFARTKFRHYLPLMPIAIEQFDLSAYDLILTSSHAVAKGVITGPDQIHVCYCHSPMRYAWDLQHQYLGRSGAGSGLKGLVIRAVLHYMRLWDTRTSHGVDTFIANSNYIARRIWKIYRRPSTVLYPPVDLDRFALQSEKADFYLTASRMVPYKRMDLIVEAFSQMPDKRLIVIGDGPELDSIKRLAGPNVEILGFQPSEVLVRYMQQARAFVFAAEEDFGITPVEAQACGTPVIAFGKGGALETVLPGVTGCLFDHQTVGSLISGVQEFESGRHPFDPSIVRAHAERFGPERFRSELAAIVAAAFTRGGG